MTATAERRPIGGPLSWLATGLATVGALWIVLLMLLVVVDVVGRGFLDAPITGVAEFCARSVVAIVYLQISAAILQGRLTRSDMILRFVTERAPRMAVLLEVTFALTGAVVFALILWASWPGMISAWQTNEFFGVRGVWTLPTLPFRAINVGGSGVAALCCTALAVHHALRLRRPCA
ncbi:MAG: TRAP transporter small permease subunit [Alkalilacustris sp.]